MYQGLYFLDVLNNLGGCATVGELRKATKVSAYKTRKIVKDLCLSGCTFRRGNMIMLANFGKSICNAIKADDFNEVIGKEWEVKNATL